MRAVWVMLALLGGQTSVASSPKDVVADGLIWKWSDGTSRRFYVASEVHLPFYMWFSASNNTEIRVSAFRVRAIVDCAPTERTRRATRLACKVEDVALQAAALPGDEKGLDSVLIEMVGKLKGGSLELGLRDDGRLYDVRLADVDERNRRRNVIRENLRLIMVRALAGLDLQLPRGGVAHDALWTQRESQILRAPAVAGTSGSSVLVHRIDAVNDGVVLIRSGGDVLLAPVAQSAGGGGSPTNYFSGTASGEARFDTRAGVLLERTWEVTTMPTASSVLAEGTMGLPYSQWGQLVALPEGATRPLGETKQMAPPAPAPSAIQQGSHLGGK